MPAFEFVTHAESVNSLHLEGRGVFRLVTTPTRCGMANAPSYLSQIEQVRNSPVSN